MKSLIPCVARLGVFVLLSVLSGCSEITTPGEALIIQTSSLSPAFVGEDYSQAIFSSGGVRPHTCKLDGTLPTGLRLDGCTLRGIAEQEGRYPFSIIVSDSNLSKTYKDYTLSVELPPPARIVLDVPNTQLSGEFRVPIGFAEARALAGMRMLLVWEQQVFEFVAVRPRRNDMLMLEALQPSGLRLDIASIDGGFSGDGALVDVVLRARVPDTLLLEARTEFASPAGHDYRTVQAGQRPRSLNSPSLDSDGEPVGSTNGEGQP